MYELTNSYYRKQVIKREQRKREMQIIAKRIESIIIAILFVVIGIVITRIDNGNATSMLVTIPFAIGFVVKGLIYKA